MKEFLPILQGINKRHLGEILWLFFSNGASIILSFAIIKIIATIGTAEYGKYSLVASMVPLVSLSIYIPIDQFSQRYYYTFANDCKKEYFLSTIISMLNKCFYFISMLMALFLMILKFLMDYDLNRILFWLIACGYVLFFTSSIPLLSLFNTMRMRKLVALFASGEKFLQLLFLSGVFLLVKLDASLVLLVFLIVAAFSFAVKMKILKQEAGFGKPGPGTSDKKLTKDLWGLLVSFGLPLAGFGFLAWLQTNGERWAIQLVMGLDSVGVFCFMSLVANTIFGICQAPFSAFIGPLTWEKFADIHDAQRVSEGMKLIRLNVIFTFLLMILGALFLFFFGKIILKILGSAVFASHYELLPVIFVGIGLYTLGQALTSVGFGYNKMVKYTIPKVTAAIMTIFGYLGGAYYWGLPGVAWGLTLTNAAYVVLIIMANKNILRRQFINSSCY